MNKGPTAGQLHTEPRRALQVVGKPPSINEVRKDSSVSGQNTRLGIIVIALVGCCFLGQLIRNRQTNAIERLSSEQQRMTALAKQLSSLTQTDLIVFPDGRVWYVRSVHGNNMEVVGWIGGNTVSEDIGSFVLREDHVTIVPHNDPAWPAQRDRFLSQ